MKVTFFIDYRTAWGERLAITGSPQALGGNGAPVPMTVNSDSSWRLSVEVDDFIDEFTYSYVVIDDEGKILRREYDKNHRFVKTGNIAEVSMIDAWHQQPADKPMFSTAFTDCILRREKPVKEKLAQSGHISLNILAPTIPGDCVLAVSGNIEALGLWDTQHALRLSDSRFPAWSAEFRLDEKLSAPLEYKFLIIKQDSGEVVAWENRDNRQLTELATGYNRYVSVDCGEFVSPLPLWRGAGTAIPVFSIRTKEDFGVGDFNSIKRMADWCASTGQRFLQLLPINDTTMTGTWTDSYPYNANSTFALHPMYLHLQSVGELVEPARREYYAKIAEELNALPTVDYERVTHTKDLYARELYAQVADSLESDADFNDFVNRNKEWLLPYAAFRFLRDRYKTADMSKWGEYARYDAVKVACMIENNQREINYHCFVQYHLDKQMRDSAAYAALKGVAIKGDIPIGISRNSVDAWINPRLFNLDCQAGAPPDAFSTLGQNWGFPTYNWEEMARDGFAWWKARFRKMAEYFDAYRIDHVLGFFRIWQIPMDAVHGLLGYFNPALPFSPEELRHNYDFWINPERQCRPYIADYMLGDFFGEYAEEAREKYLKPIEGTNLFELKDDVDTQRKVVNLFADTVQNDRTNRLRDGLLGLIDQVLFIEDPYEKGKYHPRISAQSTYIYRTLSDYEKWTFNRLYDDFFYHRHNEFWYGKAMWKLPPLIDATRMLVCAEDLGMIPECVPSVINRLQILSLEIQRMPKDPNLEFGIPAIYPYRSVCTTSTHDMGGIRQWWEEDPAATQRFFNGVLHCQGDAPHYAEPWVCDLIITQNLSSPSMLCILPLQDWLSMSGTLRRNDPREEQINVPSNPRHYWRYRMHLTVEDLIGHTDFNTEVMTKIKACGR